MVTIRSACGKTSRAKMMKCPHCGDKKSGEFPGFGVRCKKCKKFFYAGRDGAGYPRMPYLRWLGFVIWPIVGGSVVWGLTRFLLAGDYRQASGIVVTLATAAVLVSILWRYSKLEEV